MSNGLRISIAMCTYNGSQFLPEQLASIAAQIRLPDELIICDDGSTDTTQEIIEGFSRTVPFPIRFIQNPRNLGSTKNFEKAIGLCTGHLIALSDQDDIWLPKRLACEAEMMELNPTLGGVFSDAELVDAGSKPIGRRLWENIFFLHRDQEQFQAGHATDVLLKRNVVTGATVMVRASLRALFLPIPAIWVHDGWIAWMTALYSQFRLIEEPLIRYRIHANQQAGIASVTRTLPSNLRERLEMAKREEPSEHLARARELKELEKRFTATNDARSSAVLPVLRRSIRFYEERGGSYSSRLVHIGSILQNAANYPRYAARNGWKSLVRDIVIACL